MTGALFMLGLALLAAAFVGGGLKVSNVVEIPVISTRVGGLGLAFVGLIAIALGYQFHYWDAHSDRDSKSAVGESLPVVNSLASPESSPVSAVNPPQLSLDPSVFYTGTVRLDNSGLDFDLAPPRGVSGFNIEYLGRGLLYSYADNVSMAQWDQQEKPSKAACEQYVDKRGKNQAGGLTDGAIVCFRTERGRIGWLDVRSVGSGTSVVTVYATVWKN